MTILYYISISWIIAILLNKIMYKLKLVFLEIGKNDEFAFYEPLVISCYIPILNILALVVNLIILCVLFLGLDVLENAVDKTIKFLYKFMSNKEI